VYRLRSGLVAPGIRGRPLGPGEAVAITTGARLPAHTDAVVRKERSLRVAGELRVRGQITVGTDVHVTGEDLRTGDVILRDGERIRPYHLALLTAQGVDPLRLRRARVAIVPIGDELTDRPARARGEVRDSISPLIRGLTPSADCTVSTPVADRRDAIARAILRARRSSDLIVTIGGTSVGPKDFVKGAVASIGSVAFGAVRVNVLKRASVGMVGDVPVVMLPGQVVSAVVAWHEHGLHVLSRLLGSDFVRWETVRLAVRLENPHPMDTVYLFRVRGGLARPCLWGVRLYSALISSNAWGIVPRHTILPAGALLRVQPLSGADGTGAD
jgi:molybdopterin molybdotransferase